MTSKFLISPSQQKIKLTVDDLDSKLDLLIKSRWRSKMSAGYFRYYLSHPTSRRIGKFIVQLNPLRASTRRKPQEMKSVTQSFDHRLFNFTKVLLEKELICEVDFLDDVDTVKGGSDGHGQGDVSRVKHAIIINVSPIEHGHSLFVPDIHNCLPQVLTKESIDQAIRLVCTSRQHNFKMAFNSLCAYASVNHLHWHAYYLQNERLFLETAPVENLAGNCYQLNEDVYPAQGFVFQVTDESSVATVAEDVFKLVDLLIASNIAHNVFVTRGSQFENASENVSSAIRIFVWARNNIEGNKDPADFVIAVCELSGQLLIYDVDKYNSITEEEIVSAMVETCRETFNLVKPRVAEIFS